MSSTRSRRAHRPVIAPIKTDTASFPDRCHRFSNRLSIPYSGISRSRINSIGCAQDVINSGASPMRRNLSVPEVMSDVSRVTTPLGTIWISRQVCPTPLSEVSPHTNVWPAVVEAHAIRPRQMSTGHGETFQQSTAKARRVSYALPASRRRSMPTYGTVSRSTYMQLQQIQQHRHSLWEQGHKVFGRQEEADFLVKPLQLRRPRREIRSWSEEPSSASSLSKRVMVRAIIRSKSHVPIGLKREFDLDDLRATIPDPIPSPQSSNFDHEVLLSRLELSDEDLEPQSPVDSEIADDDSDVVVKTEKTDMPPFLKHSQFLPKATSVPMSVQYARAQLPALAAIMMSNRVRRGDTIELAMPHPNAWPSTVAYVYTGEREFLKENVRENILYLGGKF
ncbi:hypothetical protein GGI43DRAFT_397494 [Trichoderma evansii]